MVWKGPEATAGRGRRGGPGARPFVRRPRSSPGGWVSVVVVLAIDSLVHVYEVDGAELAKRERLRGMGNVAFVSVCGTLDLF